jgi:hypothetical protein
VNTTSRAAPTSAIFPESREAMTVSSCLANLRMGRNNHGGGLNIPIAPIRHHVE